MDTTAQLLKNKQQHFWKKEVLAIKCKGVDSRILSK